MIADFEKSIQNDLKNGFEKAGVSFAIVHNDSIILSKAFGYANQEANIAADTSTIYRIGSVSKCFTAFLMTRLIEKGIVKLHDTVDRYLPELKGLKGYGDSTRITFFQLATHSSGLPREPGLENAAQGPIANWEKKVLESIPTTAFESKPGTKFSYSNFGFAILGLALSRAAGKPFITLMEENIFIPLQMKNTFYIVPPDKRPGLAEGRFKSFIGVDLETPRTEHLGRGYKVPNGGIYSTPNDLAKFIIANFGLYPLLSANDLDSMQTGKVKVSATEEYGLGFFTYCYGNSCFVHHAGSVAGYEAELAFERRSHYGVVLTCNFNPDKVPLLFRAQQLLNQLSTLP